MEAAFSRLVLSVFLSVGAVCLSACSGGGGGGSDNDDNSNEPVGWQAGVFQPSEDFANQCSSTLPQNNWLRSWSHETYLWYDEIEDRDPGNYGDPLEYFELLKTDGVTASGSFKDNYHYTADTEAYNQQSQSGISMGYGFQWTIFDRDPEQVFAAYSDGAEWPAGVERGMRLVRIDELYMSQVSSDADIAFINDALWPSSAGEAHEFEFQGGDGSFYTVGLTAGNIKSDPVPKVDLLEGPGGERVGYLLFNSHIATAEKELVEAVEQLSAGDGIDELVLDLRYNGGGYLGIASQLAYMIAGSERTDGKTFEQLQFNDQHPTHDPVTGELLEPLPFIPVTAGFSSLPENQSLPTLDLQRVFVLTGRGTCSASESIINGLRGVDVKVVLVGDQTCGKPYGFHPEDNCGTTYFTIQFKGVNDMGFGEYSDGFVPSDYDDGYALVKGCEVSDDFSHALGDIGERRLAAALNYIGSENCGNYASSYAAMRTIVRSAGAGQLVMPQWRQSRIVRMPR